MGTLIGPARVSERLYQHIGRNDAMEMAVIKFKENSEVYQHATLSDRFLWNTQHHHEVPYPPSDSNWEQFMQGFVRRSRRACPSTPGRCAPSCRPRGVALARHDHEQLPALQDPLPFLDQHRGQHPRCWSPHLHATAVPRLASMRGFLRVDGWAFLRCCWWY